MNDSPRWRRILGALLVVVGCVLVPVSLSAIWVRNTLLDTDQYVATVGPLASDPAVQQGLATRITDAVMTRADVEEKITDALPSSASFLATPISNAVRNTTNEAALRLVESDQFQTLWENLNRKAHPVVVNVLTGGGSHVSTEKGTVAINTEPIFEKIKDKLDAKGITVFDDVTVPAKSQQFVLFQSDTLAQVQGLVDLLQTVAWVLPVLALACFAGAIGLSKRRRRTVERAAIGIAVAVGVQLALLKTGRDLYLNAVTTKKSTPGAAAAVWDQLTGFLRTSSITVFVLALVIAFAAWVVGPSSAATGLRGWWHRMLGRSDGSADESAGRVETFVAHSKPMLRGVGVAIAFVVLIAWNNPTALTVLGLAVLLVIYLGVIEFLGRKAGVAQDTDAP